VSASNPKNQYAGKTLVLSFTNTVEWRVVIGGDENGVPSAIDVAINQSGLQYNRLVDPTSINFRIEE
jgi:hypothetical protein